MQKAEVINFLEGLKTKNCKKEQGNENTSSAQSMVEQKKRANRRRFFTGLVGGTAVFSGIAQEAMAESASILKVDLTDVELAKKEDREVFSGIASGYKPSESEACESILSITNRHVTEDIQGRRDREGKDLYVINEGSVTSPSKEDQLYESTRSIDLNYADIGAVLSEKNIDYLACTPEELSKEIGSIVSLDSFVDKVTNSDATISIQLETYRNSKNEKAFDSELNKIELNPTNIVYKLATYTDEGEYVSSSMEYLTFVDIEDNNHATFGTSGSLARIDVDGQKLPSFLNIGMYDQYSPIYGRLSIMEDLYATDVIEVDGIYYELLGQEEGVNTYLTQADNPVSFIVYNGETDEWISKNNMKKVTVDSKPTTLGDLVKDNFNKYPKLKEKYKTAENFFEEEGRLVGLVPYTHDVHSDLMAQAQLKYGN